MTDQPRRIKQLRKAYRNELPHPEPNWPHDVRRALKWLNDHLCEATGNVAGMRERCRIQDHNFALRFRHYVGTTPRDYLTLHRIEMAKKLLSDEQLKDIKVSDIGFAVGYGRDTSFASQFTRKTGIPPGGWRKRQLKNSQMKSAKKKTKRNAKKIAKNL